MALTVEDGTGVVGADSYVAAATITTYWTNRQHRAEYTAWTNASSDEQDGAAREATQFVEAVFGPYYPGTRSGYVQGLQWPRTGAKDENGYLLPDLPDELVTAVCELAGRAVTAVLSEDADTSAAVKKKTDKIGPLEQTVEYFGSPDAEKKYGVVAGILAPILNGLQPNAPMKGAWAWA